MNMHSFTYKGNTYIVDSKNYLLNFSQWDENFAEGMAPKFEIPKLTKEHWDVIHFIHDVLEGTGRCPLIYETCHVNGLRYSDLRMLFPTGYFRGACSLAGISPWIGHLGPPYHTSNVGGMVPYLKSIDKTYEVDVRGFLVNPESWDAHYAVHKAYDMKINGGKLTDKHWEIIHFLRESFEKNRKVPDVYETCESNGLDLEELERLFSDGYHRGAVKIAGLRVS